MYYDGTKLLSLKDINGKQPEIYICTTNRTGGKTTYFSRLLVNRHLKHGGQFMLVYRYSYELDSVAHTFFNDIKPLFFKNMEMTQKKMCRGLYVQLFLNEKPCGIAVSLSNTDSLKKISHLFSSVNTMFMDEFQSETNKYVKDEVAKMMSLHTSVARGRGEMVRYVPLYMCSNPVSLINPYYTALGISTRIQNNTKFLRGDGFVMENGFVAEACDLQKQSGFNKAFSAVPYSTYSSEGIYLNDNNTFIEKPDGHGRYIGTLRYKSKNYGILEYQSAGVIFFSDKADESYPLKIAVTTEEHTVNHIMLARNSLFISTMRNLFRQGCFRFKNLECKEAAMTAISF